MPNVHLIGIGGAGLSAIATVLLQQNYTVSGSDLQATSTTQRLAQLGATVFVGHRPENLRNDLEVVIISSAIPGDNPELLAAQRRGIAVTKRAEWLGHMMRDKVGIAIAGTHGKTTTTAMTAYMLHEAGLDPTYIVGGYIPQLQTNAAAGHGAAFVIEADEYDHMFLGLRPTLAVLTVVEWDHPDIFPTRQVFEAAFAEFVRLVPPVGVVVACGDHAGVRNLLGQAEAYVTTYGLQAGNDWQAVEVRPNNRGGYDFSVICHSLNRVASKQEGIAANTPDSTTRKIDGVPLAVVSLTVPGLHNVANALAALVIAYHLDLDVARAAEILGRFGGVGRRFELKGEVGGITIIDDYAHHPTEIKVTLAAARTRFGKRPLWVVAQPHTFSRTFTLLDDFAQAFEEADHVIVVDIYASRERDTGLVHSRDIIDRMTHPDAHYIGSLRQTADYLVTHLSPPDVLLTFGAGDGYLVGEWVLANLESKGEMNV